MNPGNPAAPPSTFPATIEIRAGPTQSAEEEAAESLLMLAEAVGFEEEFDLADEEYHAVQSPLSSAGSSNIKAAMYVNNVALDDDMVKDPEDSTDEELHGESVGEWSGAKVEELEVEADCLIMPGERRCNARAWTCGKPAQSGSTMCSKHVKARDEILKKLQVKRLQASTGSDAINGPKTQE